MRVLLDTCVLSELRHPQGNQEVKQKVSGFLDEDLFISVITIGKIVMGISLLEDSKRKNNLLAWTANLERFYADRLLSTDLETAHIWGEHSAMARKKAEH